MGTRYFAMVAGLVFLAAGVLGFVPGFTVAPLEQAPPLLLGSGYGRLLGLFHVNVLANLMHAAVGVWGLWASRELATARTFARGVTILFGALAVLGLFPVVGTLFGLMPLFGHDVWLHAVTAAVGAYFGYTSDSVASEVSTASPTVR